MRNWRRRALPALLASVGVAGGLLVGVTGSAAQPDGSTVHTDAGVVRGAAGERATVFRGIPYAAPPVGELRWQPPRPPAPWAGVRDATVSGPVCAQKPGEIPAGSTNEDCLYLEVTRPSTRAAEPKPVVVWVHGGGFYMGAGSNYDAQRMAARGDVVVVTLNYRLGVFGFFGHPDLAGSGTFGLADQQAAFAWVRRNIAAFGGDPDNVTVAGQSAGGVSNCAHLTSPSAAGLFDKAVLQSGSCELSWPANTEFRGQPADAIYEPLAALQAQGRRTATDLGCADVDCLRALPVDKLMGVHQKFIQPAYGTPMLPVDPADAVRAGLVHRVPVLSGNTRDEGTQATSRYDNFQYAMSQQTFDAVMATTFGKDEAAVRAEYPRQAYGSAALAWAAITTDRKWACTQFATSRRLARHVPVHQYEFADPQPPALSPLPPTMPMGAQHASELWSLFDLGGMPAAFTPEQRRLSEQMIDYWTGFAATGDPARAPGPRWLTFSPDAEVPYVQGLAPGRDGVGPVDLAERHKCGFWATLGR
ncbi:para-nitrobenzyl esterase [Herbihabitans rhizosphaerae]|uniref:Carboxylic ester hydrolase n=1 Tax=Herbihabitans rhizosphaerae TaxID=1872711 RepID=A0A4V2ESX6_9PSEU|nr:carboxylesterase family protein [Herbihabitans rhizosphaerae]RZS39103.1 para-nitrobenzyl esterase [Herbihabitans rhizosphaerae]